MCREAGTLVLFIAVHTHTVHYNLTVSQCIDIDGPDAIEDVVVSSTVHVVTGLTPGVYYTFSVTAENAVSSQDNNINARTVNVSAGGWFMMCLNRVTLFKLASFCK